MSLPTNITDGYTHHFSAGDQIKWFPKDSMFHHYGDVVRVNKTTITIKCERMLSTVRVDPRELNFD